MLSPPWWALYKVVPSGADRDMGGWTASSFSDDQQTTFGVDINGDVVDVDKHKAMLKQLADSFTKEWPSAVGMAGTQAADMIREDRPDLAQVMVVAADAMVTMDFREDRVRVKVSAEGIVTECPRLG
jgi:hypothetical protein